ncbi:MAG: AraC family transcriptional regulator [Spirochaetaceae bacterium]|nr:AraC family transcriptional regulator [Spirochaetaceae bacterium]
MRIIETVFVYRLAHGEKLAWHGRYHAHNDNEFEVHYFIEGDGSFLANAARISIDENALFLAGPHEFHSIVPEQVTRPLTYYAVLFELDEQQDHEIYLLLTNILKQHSIKHHATDASRFLFDELLRLSASKQKGLEKSAEFLLCSLLYRWYSEDSSPITAKTVIAEQKKSTSIVRAAMQYFKTNIHKPVTITHVAYELGLSAEHFIRVFREEMHMTPYQYFMRLRTEAAAAELITTDSSVAEIAERYAFENQFHFSKVFKRCTGFTPTAYRHCYMQR